MHRSHCTETGGADPRDRPGTSEPAREVRIPCHGVELDADYLPSCEGRGVVVFAHGSASGRQSPRNRLVASVLAAEGFGALLLDLLEPREARIDGATGAFRFDLPLLTRRLVAATDWLVRQPDALDHSVGYFGASTGGAVAMRAAVLRPALVDALVLRGARTDLADAEAPAVGSPTLLLVGGEDPDVRRFNEETYRRLRCEKELVVVPGATHLFEEPGALEEVADRAAVWFARHLVPVERKARTAPGAGSSTARDPHHIAGRLPSPHASRRSTSLA